jgi:glycosyltransferase involved in cell wall biosynthesis
VRAVFLSTFHERCGIATYSEQLVAALRGEGADVRVLAPHLPPHDPGREGEQPPRLWGRNRAFGFQAFRIASAIDALRPDVVHAQVNLSLYSSRVLFVLAALLHRKGVPLVATLHGRRGGSWGRNFKLERLHYALRHAHLVVHGEDHRAELDRPRVHVIPHGIEDVVAIPKEQARRAIGLDPARPVLAHFGFLVPDKGIAEVLRAVAELRRGAVPDLFYWISGAVHGTAESRGHYDALRRAIAELGLAGHVHLSGEFVPDDRVRLELAAADWIALNYQTGGSQGASGAVRRALTSGRPIAVSRATIFDDVRRAAVTIEPPIAPGVARLFREPGLAEATARRGADLVAEQSWPSVARRHLALYEDVRSARR